MINIRQLNREYNNMRENEYIAQLEEDENLDLFVGGRVAAIHKIAEYDHQTNYDDYL